MKTDADFSQETKAAWRELDSLTGQGKYVCCWRSPLTGKEGHGAPMSFEEAANAARYGNRHFPELQHSTCPAVFPARITLPPVLNVAPTRAELQAPPNPPSP